MKKLENLPKIIHTCMTIGEIPTSYKLSLTYEEQLMWFCKFLETQVIPVVNNNSEAVQELQNYVANYFDNLDVQEEINNKLDEMAEDGTLEEIIAQYLNAKSILTFDTINDMKQAENLIAGSFVKTLGFYNKNDGGNAYYYIREIINTDTVNNIDLFALTNYNNLVAELYNIDFPINVKKLGIKNDGETDITDKLQYAVTTYKEIYIPKGSYLISDTIDIDIDTNIIGESMTESILINNTSNVMFEYLSPISDTPYDFKTNMYFNNLRIRTKNFIRINRKEFNNDNWRTQGSLLHLIFENLYITGDFSCYNNDTNKNTNVLPSFNDIKDYGICFDLNSIFDSRIKNCNIERFGIACYLKGCDINSIEENRIVTNSVHIWLERVNTYGSQNKICHNDMLYNYRYGGIRIEKNRYDMIENNYFENYSASGCAIYGNTELGLIIKNNRFDSPGVSDLNIIDLAPAGGDIIKDNRLNPQNPNPYINVVPTNLYVSASQIYSAIIEDNLILSNRNNPATKTKNINPLLRSPYNYNRFPDGAAVKSPYFELDTNSNLYYFYVDPDQSPTPSFIFLFYNLLRDYAKPTKIRIKYKSIGATQFYALIKGDNVQKYAGMVNITNADENIHTVDIELSDTSLFDTLYIELPRAAYRIFSVELI
ncbi:MAG: hypothetical protein IKU37_09030 [Candidatus Gastranaerophilales bacterium]|nr:hypothetical protein [Candidatus Gastranaerophilales bacterium]